MSREQLLGNKDVIDYRLDIYALGANLYHMIAGVPPYSNYDDNESYKLLLAILEHKLIPLQELRPDTPAKVLKVVSKAMALEPNERFPTLLSMKQALKECLN